MPEENKTIKRVFKVLSGIGLLAPLLVILVVSFETNKGLIEVNNAANSNGSILIPIIIIIFTFIIHNFHYHNGIIVILILCAIAALFQYRNMLEGKVLNEEFNPYTVIIITVIYFVLAFYQAIFSSDEINWDTNS